MSISRFLLLFLLLLSFSNNWAQKQKIDSLKIALKKVESPKDKSQISASIALQYYHQQIYLDSAYYYVDQAYTIAKENKLIKEQATALSMRGNIYSFTGDYNKAIDEFYKAIDLYDIIGDSKRKGSCHNNIGGTYFELREYDAAIKSYYKALDIAKKSNDAISISIASMNIAETLYVNKDYEQAKLMFEESLSTIKQTDFNPPTIHLFYARTLVALNNYETAEIEAMEAFTISVEKQDLKYAAESSKLLSEIYEGKSKYDNALKFQKEHIAYSEKINNARGENKIDKLKLNFELKEKNKQLAHAAQKEMYLKVIWVLAIIGLLLLGLFIHRQIKIVRMTKSIHDVQKRLVENELIVREKKLDNATAFQATREQDKEFK